jgi:hypothetical protein
MKILKRPDTAWSYKHTCSFCTAELEVEKSDVKYEYYHGDYRDPILYENWTATCPICKHEIHIPPLSIPKAVQVEIKAKILNDKENYHALQR